MSIKEKCGIFSTYQLNSNKLTEEIVINGLSKLQHRGQDGAGICSIDSNNLLSNYNTYKKKGLVKEVFNQHTNTNKANICIGHCRYSTSKNNNVLDFNLLHPVGGVTHLGPFMLVFNGHIPQLDYLSKRLNITYSYMNDTDFICKYISDSTCESWDDIFISLMNAIPGTYCLNIIANKNLYVIRDRYGIRPLCIGENCDGWYVSSESVAFTNQTWKYDVKPGTILKINERIKTIYTYKSSTHHCIFEYIYFMDENTIADGFSVYKSRKEMGKQLAKQEKSMFDSNTLVVGSPNSGILAGKGYAEAMNIPYGQVLQKNKNTNRSFIQPTQQDRINECKKKFCINTDISGKNIILVDDSIVRGNTIKIVIELFRKHGACDIHVRISSPPIKNPCKLGVDFPDKKELIAHEKTLQQIQQSINATTLDFLSIDGLTNVVEDKGRFCLACIDGKHIKELDW